MRILTRAAKDTYRRLRPVLRSCGDELEKAIDAKIQSLKDPYLVRVRLTEARVKKLSSIWAKAKEKNISTKEMFEKVWDLVGIRIVCSNTEDIYRVRELLDGVERLRILPDREENHIEKPTDAGYRALHVGAEYPAVFEGEEISLPVEIQVRTMLQDSWAVLVHRDVYKEGADLPEELKKLSRRLSDLLSVADDIAQDIREQVSRPTTVKNRPKSSEISKEGLAFIFGRAFKYSPADYVLQLAAAECQDLGLKRLDALERKLMESGWRERLKKVFEEKTKETLEDKTLFEMAPVVLARGVEAAEELVTERALEFLASARARRRTLLSDLPRTYKVFVRSLTPLSKDDLIDFPDRIHRYAEALGVLRSCHLCGDPIIDEHEFEEAVLEYYSSDDDSGRVRDAISSEIDTGDLVEGALVCTSHSIVLRKEN